MERVSTWENIGTDVKKCNNDVDKILKEAQLDYEVVSTPAYTKINGEFVELPKYQAVIRKEDGHAYQVAKKSYSVCQNKEAFSIVEQLKEDINVVKAGECDNGMVYLIGEMPKIQVLDDEFTPHMILQTSHNSDFALKSAVVPLRMVCQNQFNVAFHEAGNAYTIKHTQTIGNRLQTRDQLLLKTSDYLKAFSENAERLAIKKVDFNRFINTLFDEDKAPTDRILANIQHNKELFTNAYQSSDNQNFKGTAWGIVNAAMDFHTHRPSRGGSQSKFIETVTNPVFVKQVFNMLEAA